MPEISEDIKAKYGNSAGTFALESLGLLLTDLSETKPSKSEILEAIAATKGLATGGRISFSDFSQWLQKTYHFSNGGSLNRLLLKYPLGKGRRSGYDLPPTNHVFGKLVPADAEGAREVLGWMVSSPSPDEKQCRDLVKLNKMATMEGCINASAVRTFHKEHEILKKAHVAHKKGGSTKLPKKYEGATFGEPSCPSTPVRLLMKQDVSKEDEGDYPVIDRKRHTTPAIRTTKAARGQDVRYIGVTDAKRHDVVKEPFKLKKFTRVPPRVSSNNNASPNGRELDLSELADQLESEMAPEEQAIN